MESLLDSPHLLLLVIEQTNLFTLLNLCRINKSTSHLISGLETSICKTLSLRTCAKAISVSPHGQASASSIKELVTLSRQQLVQDLADLITLEHRISTIPRSFTSHTPQSIREVMYRHLSDGWGITWRGRTEDMYWQERKASDGRRMEYPNGEQPRFTAPLKQQEIDVMYWEFVFVQRCRDNVRRKEALDMNKCGLALLEEILERLYHLKYWHDDGEVETGALSS